MLETLLCLKKRKHNDIENDDLSRLEMCIETKGDQSRIEAIEGGFGRGWYWDNGDNPITGGITLPPDYPPPRRSTMTQKNSDTQRFGS